MSGDYESLARAFKEFEGRWPSRIDWRNPNLEFYRGEHGLDYPHEKTVYRQYGGWRHFLAKLGVGTVVTQETAAIAEEFLRGKYKDDIEFMPGASGTIDCHYKGLPTEVKASTLYSGDRVHTPRFRFRMHKRTYSSIVDHMILVGIHEGEPIAEWHLDKVAILEHADNIHALNVVAKYPFQFKMYPLFFYQTWLKNISFQELTESLECSK